MKKFLKRACVLLFVSFITFFGAANVFGGTVEGEVQGFGCVAAGAVCPIDRLDPHIATEKIFVVTTGDKYYFVTNLDRAMLSRYVAQKVRVSGKVSSKHNSIKAEKFQVYQNNTWLTTWDADTAKKEMFESLETGPN